MGFFMGFQIINAISKETIEKLNSRFHLSLHRSTMLTAYPETHEFSKYKKMMENNKSVEYECTKD